MLILSFWGTFFLIILLSVFNISLLALTQDVFSTLFPLNIYAGYLIVSLPVFVILEIVNIHRSHNKYVSILEVIILDFQTLVWTPYMGFVLGEFFRLKELGAKGVNVPAEVKILLRRFAHTIIWWFALIYAIYLTINMPDCALAISLKGTTKQDVIFKAIIVVGVIIAMNIIGYISSHIVYAVWRKQFAEEDQAARMEDGTKGQKYYDRHPERMPNACRACGGPYPECKASCNLYDE